MNNRELKDIIQKIEVNEGLNLKEIAQAANADRSYMSKLLNNVEKKEVGKRLLNKLIKAFPVYFHLKQQNPQITPAVSLDVVLEEIQYGQAAIIAEIRGYGQYLVMESAGFDDKRYEKAKALVDKIYYANLGEGAEDGNKKPSHTKRSSR